MVEFFRDFTEAAEDWERQNRALERELAKSRQKFRIPRR